MFNSKTQKKKKLKEKTKKLTQGMSRGFTETAKKATQKKEKPKKDLLYASDRYTLFTVNMLPVLTQQQPNSIYLCQEENQYTGIAVNHRGLVCKIDCTKIGRRTIILLGDLEWPKRNTRWPKKKY